MKKRMIPALLLSAALMVGQAGAIWAPAEFQNGAPSAITADGDGFLITDVFNKVIWRADNNGVELQAGQISVEGLDGEPIGKYDDGSLDSALFMEPWGIAPFLDGYAITDSAAHVVRFIDDTGVYTAGGTGKASFHNGVGTLAAFHNPTGIAAGYKGELYIADTGNNCIRVMDKNGNVSTWTSSLVEPTGICWHDGSLYVAETGRSRILKITKGTVQVLAGGEGADKSGIYPGGYVDGPVSKARFEHPEGIAVAEDGTIYVADTGNRAIRKICNGTVTTVVVATDTPSAPAEPRGMLLHDGTLYVTDLLAQQILMLDVSPVSYTDVPTDAPYHDAVVTATEYGLTAGTGNGAFSPSAKLTRAMFVTMMSKLHRITDGNAIISGSQTFSDVSGSEWYANPVAWAADQGIVAGDGQRFMPDQNITMEQLLTIVYQYARTCGYDVSQRGALSAFADQEQIAAWAAEPVAWALGSGLITADESGCLSPQQPANRAQTVEILVGFMHKFEI